MNEAEARTSSTFNCVLELPGPPQKNPSAGSHCRHTSPGSLELAWAIIVFDASLVISDVAEAENYVTFSGFMWCRNLAEPYWLLP